MTTKSPLRKVDIYLFVMLNLFQHLLILLKLEIPN